MFYLDSKINDMCCGCEACKMICPTQCISMYEDEEGFKYPEKNEKLCINCGLCEKVCPFVEKEKIDHIVNGDLPKAYLAINMDREILFNSASGGVFSAVAKAYCKGDFVIFGVQFDDITNAIHTYTNSLDESKKYMKSKYIQSDINNTYKEAERFLKSGSKVLFTGTPCQIAGLRLFLGKDYENLFCLDLVCHGVPNQIIFNKYIKYIENKYNKKVIDFTFRHKTIDKRGKRNSRNIKIKFGDEDIIMSSNEDEYLKGFHSGLFYRPSCYNCKYANSNRVSDITMADFWGVEKIFKEEDVHKGVSVILVNTKRGQTILKELGKRMDLREVDLNYVINSNGQLKHPPKKHINRRQFFELVNEVEFNIAIDACMIKVSLIRGIASRLFPEKIKILIRKIIN